MRKVILCLLALLLVGCTKQDAVVETVSPTIESTPVVENTLIDDSGYQYTLNGDERIYDFYDGNIKVFVKDPIPDSVKFTIYEEKHDVIGDTVIVSYIYQPEGCEEGEEGCYCPIAKLRLFKGDMVQPNDENGWPYGYTEISGHNGYQIYSADELELLHFNSKLTVDHNKEYHKIHGPHAYITKDEVLKQQMNAESTVQPDNNDE